MPNERARRGKKGGISEVTPYGVWGSVPPWVNPATSEMDYVCEELDTIQENWGDSEFTARVTLRVPWDQTYLLIQEIRGGEPDGDGSYVEGRHWPWKNNARFQSASIVPFPEQVPTAETTIAGSSTTPNNKVSAYLWKEGLVTITYSTNMALGKYIETIEPNVEFQILNHLDFSWNKLYPDPPTVASDLESLKDVREAPSRQIRGAMYTVDIINMPIGSFDPSEYIGLIGCVNDTEITLISLNKTYNYEEILLIPSSVKCRVMQHDDSVPSGSKAFFWDYTLKYAIKRHDEKGDEPPNYQEGGWNAFWRGKTKKYEYIYPKAGGGFDPIDIYPLKGIMELCPGELWEIPGAMAVEVEKPRMKKVPFLHDDSQKVY